LSREGPSVVHVEKLTTTNFRNLEAADIEFSPGVNLLIGENGHGKTNLLEAVSFFKLGRSFRTNRDAELIRFDESYCRVETRCAYKTGGAENFAAAIDQDGAKKITTGAKKISKLSELIGRYPVVMFGPRDLGLVTGPPGERRRFVDMVGSMTDRAYVELLKDYRRVVEQRNAALKARADAGERRAWNAELVEKGSKLVMRRQDVVGKIENYLASHAVELEAPFDFSLRYETTLIREDNADVDEAALEETFFERLREVEGEELRKCTTLVGPHRDDVKVNLNGRDLRRYGSQGQKRLFAIMAKLSEQTYVETELKEPCVLMLDDVFSEFDVEITEKLQRVFEGGRQVFVTSPVSLEWERSRAARVIYLRSGRHST